MKGLMLLALIATSLAFVGCDRQHDSDEAPRTPGFHLLAGGDVVIQSHHG